MPRILIRARLAVSLTLLAFSTISYGQDSAAREAEWQAYRLPTSNFVRYVHPSKTIMLRVPADWPQQGAEPVFKGPGGSHLQVAIEKVPDGIPLPTMLAEVLQHLRNLPGGPDSLKIRRTQLSGVDAREISFEVSDEQGRLTKRVLWCAVDGPNFVTLVFIVPGTRAAELEPYFKGVAQSAVIFRGNAEILKNGFRYDDFESLRKSAIKADGPASRIDEVQSLVSEVEGGDSSLRASAVTRLASIFAGSPDSAIDLVMEHRPLMRAATVEAIAASKNRSLDPFLFAALSDPDSYVAVRAAVAVASRPDAVALLRSQTGSNNYTTLLRASAFLDEKARAQIAAELLNGTFVKPPPLEAPPSATDRRTVQASRPPSGQPPVTKPVEVPKGSIEVKGVPGGVPGEAGAVKPNLDVLKALAVNPDFIALNLVRDIPASVFKLPLAKIVARKSDNLIASALQVALERREALPLDELLKLLDSPSPTVTRLAAMNLPRAANHADIPRIESLAEKLSSQSKSSAQDPKKPAPTEQLATELRGSIARIRFKQKLEAVDQQSRGKAIKQALDDPQLASWVWSEYALDEMEGPVSISKESSIKASSAAPVSPLGENLFPRNVALYVALPNPAAALGKLNDGLANIQTESARSQATLVLIMSAIKGQIAKFFGAQGNEAVLGHIGIRADRPIAFAKWTAEGAPVGLHAAERKAVLMHVSDSDRFEQVLAHYQERTSNFARLPELVSTITRFLGFAPAILPIGALTVLKEGPESAEQKPIIPKYQLILRSECIGHEVKVFERRDVTLELPIKSDYIYLAYSGDAAVLAPDWYSLRDALSRLDNKRGGLDANPEFKRAVATAGDAIYLSSPAALFNAGKKLNGDEVTESGALKMSNTAWESSYQLSFNKGGWSKLFAGFQPKDLAAPRELLPRSTLGYIFTRPDLPALWRNWGTAFFGPEVSKNLSSVWAMDFDKEVISELSDEFGAALLGLPKLDSDKFDAPWIVFFKLKTDKLSRAFSEGKLFKEPSSGNRAVKLRIGSTDLVAGIRNGYLVFAANEAAIQQLDQKEKLNSARDFARAAERTPKDVVAFGGYSLEAAVAELGTGNADPVKAFIINAATSLARAFHSQHFYATETRDGLDARLSVSLDREGRYSVAELQSLSKDFAMTFAVIEARGVPIADQSRVETLKLRIRAKASGVVDRVKEDIASPHQILEKQSENELLLAVKPRHTAPVRTIQLSEIGAGFESFLKPTSELRSDDPTVIKQALEIVGGDREAWSVARKLSDWTFKNLKWKSVDKADAAQTLATREADCLEFSQLFVAMARSLRLPARIVSGLAYGGGSFGGHAWVEVWAGEWVELDPTWGTDFVDATHIRTASGELINYAALNLLEVEVLEAPRSVPDFQRSSKAFAEKLCEELATGSRGFLSLALGASVLTDEHMGAGTWSGMSGHEREQMSSAYLRLVLGLSSRFKPRSPDATKPRLVGISQSGERADAVMDSNDELVRLKLTRRGEAWTLVDIVYSDSGYRLVSESLQPVIQTIRAQRSGKPLPNRFVSAQTNILLTLEDEDASAERILESLRVADEALKEDPKNQTLRQMKAMCLGASDDAMKGEEAAAIWEQLSAEDPPFAPALMSLAEHYRIGNNANSKRAIELLQRYAALVPDDPHPHGMLAELYESEGDLARAEGARRSEIERDPLYPDHYTDLAELLAVQKRYDEACAALDEGAKYGKTADDLFASLYVSLYYNDREAVAEGLGAARPERLNRNAGALITLAHIRIERGSAREALPLLRSAVGLAPKNGEAHVTMSEAFRKLANWRAALEESDAGIAINAEDSTAQYERACALARLGRKTQAIAALKRAIEIDGNIVEVVEAEEDLKPLAAMPEFKKLVAPKPEKQWLARCTSSVASCDSGSGPRLLI